MLINMVLPGAVETARLPKEYQEVAYIQSSGTQYIKTKFIPNQNTRVVCKVNFPKVSATAFLFGSRGSGNSLWYNFLCTAAGFRSDFYNDTTAFAHNGGEMLIDKNKNVTTVNEAVVRTSTYGNFTTSYPLYLFAENNAGAVYSPCSATAEFFQIYNGEDLALDYVPCYRKSDGAAGVYDLVNNTFEGNSGTGEFIVGPDVNKAPVPPSGGNDVFPYTGSYTDNRVNGKGTVRLNSSGILTVDEAVTVTAVIVGAGGGGACTAYHKVCASGGGGGNQTVEVELTPGTYDIIIGTGGESHTVTAQYYNATSSAGGNTTAFGYTSTGGSGAYAKNSGTSGSYVGTGGTPNGGNGNKQDNATNLSGGSPNGGGVVNSVAQPGGDGYVELTFI